jgi:hypothetical protein
MSWFEANFLLLNFNKSYYLEFRTKNCIDYTLDINDFNKSVANITYTKFLGLVIFKMQKRVIRILMGIGYRESCSGLFKDLKILPFASQYILFLLLFVVHNKGYFAPNSVYHNFNNKQKNAFHLPHVSLTIYQSGVFYSGIKFFNAFPSPIKDISGNPKSLKFLSSSNYLLTHFITYMSFSVNRMLNLCHVRY